jgi:RimJ/RimL family protein N-acetyltransferase
MDWARREHAIRHFIVSVSPTNRPSLGMAAKLGFQRIGTQIDEIDGEEYVFERVFED